MNFTKRQINEKKFHNKLANEINIDEVSIKDAFSIGAQENRFAQKLFGNLRNKHILDIGCGYGDTAVFWATQGAIVEGVDISNKMVKLACNLAEKYNVDSRCYFRTMTAERLHYSAKYFDFVFGNSVLHHVDLIKAVTEAKRVLKKGGLAIFIEPLTYNPLIKIYRKLADKVRTKDESPLSFNDVTKLNRIFPRLSHKEFHFLTLLIFVWFFLVSRIHPNEERYWKKLLKVKGGLKFMLRILVSVDNFILTIFPPLRYWCWNIVIILQK